MPDETETETGEERDDNEQIDIESQFREARDAAGLDPDQIGYVEPGAAEGALLSPYLLLYAGFFLGPPATFAVGLLVGPRALTVRRVSVILGICGAVWCAIQGATAALEPGWNTVALQVLRSGLNFAGSTLVLLFWRREIPGRFQHERSALTRSIGAGIVLLAIFSVLPAEILAFLGR